MQILAKWEEYASVKTWKKGLKENSHKNKFSPHTLESIRIWMPLYLEYSQKNPDDLIEEALSGKETVRARLSDFCTWLQDEKGKKYNAAVQGAYAMIRGFYSHNNVSTQKIRIPRLQPSQVQFSDDNLPLFDVITNCNNIQKKIIRRDFLKEFFTYLNSRDQIIALCIMSSGLDSGDLLNIKLATIRYQDPNQDRIFIRDLRNKTGESVTTFFSTEASKLVRNYVNTFRKDAEDSEPVFVLAFKELKKIFRKKNGRKWTIYDDELKPVAVEPESISNNFRDAVIRYNKEHKGKKIQLIPNKQSPLRPKRFRKVFNDACDDAGITTDIKRVFMGKSDPANKTYEGKSRQDLEIYYKKVEPNLVIFSEPTTTKSEDVKKLQEDLDLMKKDKKEQRQKMEDVEFF